MKKIAIFSANYLPNTGGVERYTFNLSKELANRGFEITIVTSNVFHLKEYEQLSKNIEIYRLPCLNILNGRFPVLKFWSNTHRRLDKNIRNNFYDLVIVNTRYYLHSLYGAKIGKKCSKKVICIDHSSAHLTVNSPFWDFLGRRFEHFITRLLKNKIKDFYGVSEKCNEWLLHFKIKAKGCLYNAVDIKEISNISNTSDFNIFKKLNIPHNSKIVTFTGRLVYEKGIIQLIEAVNKIVNEHKRNDIHLLIAGNGPLEEQCRSSESNNIHYLGKLTFDKVISVLNVSNIFCFPSFFPEGFPTSVLEAAACKNYIIATPAGGTKQLIKDNSYGTLLPNKPTTDDISDSILNVIDNPKAMIEAINKTYDNLIENFTWIKTADDVCKIIN